MSLEVRFAGDESFCFSGPQLDYHSHHDTAAIKLDGRKIGEGELGSGFAVAANTKTGKHKIVIEWKVTSYRPNVRTGDIGESVSIRKKEVEFEIDEPGNAIFHIGFDEGNFVDSGVEYV